MQVCTSSMDAGERQVCSRNNIFTHLCLGQWWASLIEVTVHSIL